MSGAIAVVTGISVVRGAVKFMRGDIVLSRISVVIVLAVVLGTVAFTIISVAMDDVIGNVSVDTVVKIGDMVMVSSSSVGDVFVAMIIIGEVVLSVVSVKNVLKVVVKIVVGRVSVIVEVSVVVNVSAVVEIVIVVRISVVGTVSVVVGILAVVISVTDGVSIVV